MVVNASALTCCVLKDSGKTVIKQWKKELNTHLCHRSAQRKILIIESGLKNGAKSVTAAQDAGDLCIYTAFCSGNPAYAGVV